MLISMVQAWLAWFAAQQSTVCKPEWKGKIETVVEQGKTWRVRHNATTWFAHSVNSANFRPGDWVRVIGRQGLTLLIEPLQDHQR